MTRYICIFLIALIVPRYLTAQSICIDSSTVKNANYYLIKGAKARELNCVYQKRIATDSTLIEFQDSLISDLEFVICEIDTEQKVVKKYSIIATIYSIVVTLFLLK